MAANKWKQKGSELLKNEKFATLMSNIKQQVTSLMSVKGSVTGEVAGLDIGPDRIKLLRINSASSPFEVMEYASAPLPSGVIVKDEIKDPVAIGSVLRDLIKSSGTTAKYAAVAIPRSLAIIKTITIDKRLSARDIESRAWIEASRHFPDLVGNIYLDFTITGASMQTPDQMELLLVACRKEHLKPYLDLLQQAALIPKIVDVNCYALERVLQLAIANQPELNAVALLNVNVTQSSLIVLSNGQLIHAHDQSFDGQRLLNQVNEFIKTKREQPGMEQAPILVEDAAYYKLLQENFISHLRHAIHLFYSSRSNIKVDKIILSGDCTVIPDFTSFVEKEIGINTVLANPFSDMKISSKLNADEINKNAPALMLCSGLALSGMGGRS
ncbi:MAG TPA: type IV pilus assembly protein PilM [Gammaproteobacteria bacterium]|nr:type IV pilus assembly protein PilM [Gammaproteobacteria bacterium]